MVKHVSISIWCDDEFSWKEFLSSSLSLSDNNSSVKRRRRQLRRSSVYIIGGNSWANGNQNQYVTQELGRLQVSYSKASDVGCRWSFNFVGSKCKLEINATWTIMHLMLDWWQLKRFWRSLTHHFQRLSKATCHERVFTIDLCHGCRTVLTSWPIWMSTDAV